MINPDIRDFTRQELAGALIALGEKGAKADRVFNCLYRKGAGAFEAMDGLTPEFKAKLARKYSLAPQPAVEKLVSKLDGTIKLLLRFADGAAAESVVLFNKKTVSACVSSQSGCACGCTFCATGALGFKRDLKPSEILAQYAACRQAAGRPLDSLVFMGMGEPFLNWANVKKSLLILSDNKGCNFPQQRITVSTVGVVPVIKELAESHLEIKLAVSVITADQQQRAQLTPMDKKYPLADIIKAARHYCTKTGRTVFFEYILFDGRNDTPEDARKLLTLIKDAPCKVNLIQDNQAPVSGTADQRFAKAKAFQDIIVAGGIRTHLRREKGADIAAACGQLAAGGEIAEGK
ncbi:MAG: 23S rRNA (adenine(2503)-C(2))-methyltransferase [Elusimicrobia bacterium RIFOXYA12_FULL_57_11]|nr:MAG: 23S rRNA (adenine(2503)-C(2))-methyltransferase [Elusimicrobia bacterium RIFOXYA12_FULL_57_11]